jgi:hypothetical protein
MRHSVMYEEIGKDSVKPHYDDSKPSMHYDELHSKEHDDDSLSSSHYNELEVKPQTEEKETKMLYHASSIEASESARSYSSGEELHYESMGSDHGSSYGESEQFHIQPLSNYFGVRNNSRMYSRRLSLVGNGLQDVLEAPPKDVFNGSSSESSISETQKEVLKNITREIAGKQAHFHIFYNKLFELNPSTKALFEGMTSEERAIKFIVVSLIFVHSRALSCIFAF